MWVKADGDTRAIIKAYCFFLPALAVVILLAVWARHTIGDGVIMTSEAMACEQVKR